MSSRDARCWSFWQGVRNANPTYRARCESRSPLEHVIEHALAYMAGIRYPRALADYPETPCIDLRLCRSKVLHLELEWVRSHQPIA